MRALRRRYAEEVRAECDDARWARPVGLEQPPKAGQRVIERNEALDELAEEEDEGLGCVYEHLGVFARGSMVTSLRSIVTSPAGVTIKPPRLDVTNCSWQMLCEPWKVMCYGSTATAVICDNYCFAKYSKMPKRMPSLTTLFSLESRLTATAPSVSSKPL